MITKDIFFEFYSISKYQEREFWYLDFQISEECFLNLLDSFYKDVQTTSLDETVKYATTICLGINRINPSSAQERVMLDFLRFQICISILPVLSGEKRFNKLFHWLSNSISDEVSENHIRNFHPDIVESFLKSEIPYVKNNVVPFFIIWSLNLFYYARVEGGLQDLVKYYIEHLFDELLLLCNRTFYHENLDLTLAQIISWSNNNNLLDLKEKAVSAIIYLYESPEYPGEWLKNIEFTLACGGYEYTAFSQMQWLDKILSGSYELNAHELMQVLALKYSNNLDSIIGNLQEIKGSISVYHDYLAKLRLDEKKFHYEITRSFNLLSPIIAELLANGKINLLNELIGYYFRIEPTELIDNNNFYVIPYSKDGAMYVKQDYISYSGKDVYTFRKKITDVLNRFLNWTVTVPDDFTYLAPVPYRSGVGVPNKDYGQEFEDVLIEYFDLGNLEIWNTLSGSSGYYFYSTYQFPFQALFVKKFGYSPPLIQSFYKPLPARKLKNVLIWAGDCMTSEFECNAVCSIFEQHGVFYKRFNWYEANKNEFMDEYYSNKYDLVWMSCHGEFDHFETHNSSLVLNTDYDNIKGQAISYSEIRAFSNRHNERRLLVLNACDGASTSLHNSPSAIGFGAKLTNSYQSLISHLWPADNSACLSLGCLLAINLCKGLTYSEAYSTSLNQFIDNTVLENLQAEYNLGLIKENILIDPKIDHNNIFYYGSMAYME